MLVKDRRANIVDFVVSLYDEGTGGFKQCAEAPATVYATEHAIRLLRPLERVSANSFVGYSKAADILGEERLARAVQFIRDSQCPETLGFAESPELLANSAGATVISTKQAYIALREVGREHEIQQDIRSYLVGHCLRETEGGGLGFSENAFRKQPFVCTTQYALRVLSRIDKEWVNERLTEFVTFTMSCFVSKDKYCYFKPHPQKKRGTVIHTTLALRGLDILRKAGPGAPKDLQEFGIDAHKLIAYIALHQDKNGGFKLYSRPWWLPEMFTPHLPLTRSVIRTLSLFKDNPECVAFLDKMRDQKTMGFLNSLSSSNPGVYKGRLEIPNKFLEMIRFKKWWNILLLPRDTDRTERETRPVYIVIGNLIGFLSAALGLFLLFAINRKSIQGDWAFLSLCFAIGVCGFEFLMAIELVQWLKKRS